MTSMIRSLAIIFIIIPFAAWATDIPGIAIDDLEGRIAQDTKDEISRIAESKPDADYESLGLLTGLGGNQPLSAWAYMKSVQTGEDSPVAAQNLAVHLFDMGRREGNPVLEDAAIAILSEQAADYPSDWAIYRNLGAMFLDQHKRGGASGDLAFATAFLEHAYSLNQTAPQILMTFAEALELAGDRRADTLLRSAYLLNPGHISVMAGYERVPNFSERLSGNTNACNAIDFRCPEVCPPISIVGGLEFTQCEISQTAAKLACMDGEPFPTAYACLVEAPAFGIFIPGLQNGFSIPTPKWGTLTVSVDANGIKIKYKSASASLDKLLGLKASGSGTLVYDHKTGNKTWTLGGGVGISTRLPGQKTLNAAKNAGLSAGGGLSVSGNTDGAVKATAKGYGIKVKGKGRMFLD